MKRMTLKISQCLMITGLLIILSTPCFAMTSRLTAQEMSGITGQSGLQTFIGDGLTEEHRREEDKKNRQTQELMALSALIPYSLLRDLQYVRYTVNDSTRIAHEFNTIQRDLLTVPTGVTTIINLPGISLGGVGGFF